MAIEFLKTDQILESEGTRVRKWSGESCRSQLCPTDHAGRCSGCRAVPSVGRGGKGMSAVETSAMRNV